MVERVVTTRRSFLWGCGLGFGAGLGVGASGVAAWVAGDARPASPGPALTADLHVHLFGTGDGGSGCHLSAAVRRSLVFRALVTMLRLKSPAASEEGEAETTLDARYRASLIGAVRASGIDRVAILAQDAAYGADGLRDGENTHFFVPNDYVLQTCAEHPDRMVPCVSINPQRRDAVAELERCYERGARMLKIHPPTQGVDVADPKHAPFFRRCAALDVLVLVHTGHEHSAPVVDIELADPARLAQALELGCRVVACHGGTGRTSDRPDFVPHLLELARRHERLWADTSVLCTMGRQRDLDRLLDDAVLRTRLVHGSDFPFPAIPLLFAEKIGRRRALDLTADRNLIRRDFLLKEELGLRDCAERAHRLLSRA